MALSELVQLYKKTQPTFGQRGPRVNPRTPAQPGLARGTMGATGARLFQARDSEAGLKKELETMNSPIFRAFARRFTQFTPITRALQGGQ